MDLPATPHQRAAAPFRAPAHSTIAHPLAPHARRDSMRPLQAQWRTPFGFSFKSTFPWIDFSRSEPSPPAPPTTTPTTSPTPAPPSGTTTFYPPTPEGGELTTELGELKLPLIGIKVSNAFPDLRAMREAFGPMLPADIKYTEVTPENPALKGMAFKSSYDEGFCGHFTIPGKKDLGAAATFQNVMATDDPFSFIQDHLRSTPEAGRSDINSDELVIFTPGLRTMHNVEIDSQETAPSRLQHYANTLGCSLAQLHIGTDVDQGDVEIKVSLAMRAILTAAKQQMADAGLTPIEQNGDTIKFDKGQRDKLEAGLAIIGFARPLWQDHIIQLLKLNEKERRPLVIMPYSRTAAELTSTLKSYISGYEGEKAEVEALLRETLTVVTLGNGTRNFGWPDGPAYVHVGGWSEDQEGPPPAEGSVPLRGTDPGIFYEGVHAGTPEAAGADAVYVHADWVWSTGEAHNFASSGGSSLRLVLALNGITGFRELYNRLSAGEQLKMPTFEQVKAAVVITGGQDFLWNKGPGPRAGVGKFPSQEDAQKLVGEWM